MGFLAYQFPNASIHASTGDWKKSSLDAEPNDHFLLTDFEKKACYYFLPNEKVNDIHDQELSFQKRNTVFSANKEAYLNGLRFFRDGFEGEGIQKAIYSRIQLMKNEDKATCYALFLELADRYKEEALVYLVSDPEWGTWIGATPEILLSGNEDKIESMALAGTKKDKDIEWTPKEVEEQQIVADFMQAIIQSHATEFKITPTETVKKGAIYHLRTHFSFCLPVNKWNTMIDQLHPTPAVCGTPRDTAMSYILDSEPHERAFYTGVIGLKSTTQLKLFVNLRCMQVLDDYFALYLGGGITPASDENAEWEETENKAKTLLDVVL